MDGDLLLTLVNNDCHEDDVLIKQLSIPRTLVPFESFFGFALELVALFIAASDFYPSDSPPSSTQSAWAGLGLVVKLAAEELVLFASWEFWERPEFRVIMLKQLTVRNLLFQARYFPWQQSPALREVLLLQPVVVLTLAAMHIVIERGSSHAQPRVVQETRDLVSRLVSEVGIHMYLGMIVMKLAHEGQDSPIDQLWLKTALLTMVFQIDMLMFGVIMIVVLTGDLAPVKLLFDGLVVFSLGSLLRMRLKDKTGVSIGFGLSHLQGAWSTLSRIDSKNISQAILSGVSNSHALFELVGFIAEFGAAWYGDQTGLGTAAFALAFLSSCLQSDEPSVSSAEGQTASSRTRSSIYAAEAVISYLALICLTHMHDRPDWTGLLQWCAFMLSTLVCMLSCAGLRDLLHISRF